MRVQFLCGTVFACGNVAAYKALGSRADEPCAQVSSMVVPMRAASPTSEHPHLSILC
jgi:hypothetical protein